MPATRPPKHTRASAPPPPQLKYERTPSPSSIERRLVTSGTRRYAPIPNNCLSSWPEYKQHRSDWVERCAKELEALNLIPERKLIRDDGLIIDWRSHVPVWSDTLKPDPLDLAATIMLAHRSNAQWHHPPIHTDKSVATTSTRERSTSNGAQLPSQKTLPVPPRPSFKRRNKISQPIPVNSPPGGPGSSSPCSEIPRSPDETERGITSSVRPLSCDRVSSLADHMPIPSDISDQYSQVALPPKPLHGVCDPSIAPCASSAAEEEMSEMTLKYLHRYVQTYEADRASLASAYARNASFAYRVHQAVRNTSGATSSQCFSSGTKRSRLDVVTTLLTLPGLHSNVQRPGTAQVEYDMFYLGTELGMFVRKEVDMEDAATEGVWPLTATAHQILVFET